jgi:hypothetical protein
MSITETEQVVSTSETCQAKPDNPVTKNHPVVNVQSLQFGTELDAEIILSHFEEEAGNQLPVEKFQLQLDIRPSYLKIVINWLCQVRPRLGISWDALFFAIVLLYKFLTIRSCPKDKLQLAALSALILTTNCTEHFVPTLSDYQYIASDAFTRQSLTRSCEIMFEVCSFDVFQPQAAYFLSIFVKQLKLKPEQEKRLRKRVNCFYLFCLCDWSLLNALPSELAFALICIARRWGKMFRIRPLQKLTGYSWKKCKPLIETLQTYLMSVQPGQMAGILEGCKMKWDELQIPKIEEKISLTPKEDAQGELLIGN